MRPTRKIPISKERIEAAKKLFNSGDYNGAAAHLRELREARKDELTGMMYWDLILGQEPQL